jgi:hypothetical protein
MNDSFVVLRLVIGLVLAALVALTACAGTPPAARQILDEETGNTFFVVTKPLVFARERTDVAAHARDYATLVAVAVDESGTISEYVLLHRWSTVDRRMLPPPKPDAGELRILAEGRAIDLVPLEQVPVSLSSRAELHGPTHGDAITRAYKVDLPTLRFIAMSRTLAVRMPQEPLDTPFGLWRDGRTSLTQFVTAQGGRER